MNGRLRDKLADIGFVGLLAAVALAAWTALDVHRHRLDQQAAKAEERSALRDIRHLDDRLAALFQTIDLNLKTLLDIGHTHYSAPQWTAQMQYALHHAPYIRSLSLVSEEGTVIASTSATNVGLRVALTDFDPRASNAIEQLRVGIPHAGRDLADGWPATDEQSPTPVTGFIPVLRALSRGEGGTLALLATLNTDYLLGLLDDQRPHPSDRLAVIRYDGFRLLDTGPPSDAQQTVERELVSRWQSGENSAFIESGAPRQGHQLAAYRLNRYLPLAVVSMIDLDRTLGAVYEENRSQALTAMLLALIGIAAALGGYLFFRIAAQRERALRRRTEARQKLLESALNASAHAIVITSPAAVIEWANPAFSALTGYDASEAIGRQPKELVNSGRQAPEIYANMWATILSGEVWRGELVNRRKDGSHYNEEITITPVREADGAIGHFVAIKEDITRRKEIQTELEAAHARLETVVNHFPGAVVMENAQGLITLMNTRALQMLGYADSPRAVVGSPIAPLTRIASRLCRDPRAFLDRTRKLHAAPRAVFGEEFELVDGRWIERDFIPLFAGERLLGYLRIYRDITARKTEEGHLRHLASTDPLTGVANRRAFLDLLAVELARTQRYLRPGALLMLDLDHFKRVNDEHGHPAGDAVLCRFAAVVSATLRDTDALGRLGGEEFGILLPETTSANALELAERIRAAIELTETEAAGVRIKLTVSIGVAPLLPSDRDVEAAIARADAALYVAKHHGRNRVELPPPT